MKLTKREHDYLTLLYLNPMWKIVQDNRGYFHLEKERLHARPVRSLIHKGLIEAIAEFKDTGYAHFALSDAGRKVIEDVRRAKLEKKPRSYYLKKYRVRGGRIPKSWHKKNDPKIIQMRMEGASVRTIARKFGVSEITIRRILRPHGLIKRYRRLSTVKHYCTRREWGDIIG